MNKKLIEELEQNFLDGDKIDDCGGAMFSSKRNYKRRTIWRSFY